MSTDVRGPQRYWDPCKQALVHSCGGCVRREAKFGNQDGGDVQVEQWILVWTGALHGWWVEFIAAFCTCVLCSRNQRNCLHLCREKYLFTDKAACECEIISILKTMDKNIFRLNAWLAMRALGSLKKQPPSATYTNPSSGVSQRRHAPSYSRASMLVGMSKNRPLLETPVLRTTSLMVPSSTLTPGKQEKKINARWICCKCSH